MFNFKKKYGQNFLTDKNLLNAIVKDAEIDKDDFVVEIGAGAGALTCELSKHAKKVVAFEIDNDLKEILSSLKLENVAFRFEDFMKVDLKEFDEPFKVVANLPYYITTPIIFKLLEESDNLLSLTVMVQKEVADRMQSGPGKKDYGALSLAVQYYASPYIVANVPPNCFMPRPKVGSAVIRLTRYKQPPVAVKNEKLLFQIIRASFNQRRKTLVNGLANSGQIPLTKEQIAEGILTLGKGAGVRGEALTLEEFAKLADYFQDQIQRGAGS